MKTLRVSFIFRSPLSIPRRVEAYSPSSSLSFSVPDTPNPSPRPYLDQKGRSSLVGQYQSNALSLPFAPSVGSKLTLVRSFPFLSSRSTDRQIRVWDVSSGVLVHSIASSLGEISSVDIDYKGHHLLVSSKDNSNTLFDLRMVSRTCVVSLPLFLVLLSTADGRTLYVSSSVVNSNDSGPIKTRLETSFDPSSLIRR